MSNIDLLAKLPAATLKAERTKAEKAGNHRFATDLGTALRRQGYVDGTPDPFYRGLTRRRVDLDGTGLGMRPAWTHDGEIMSWMQHFMTGGQGGHFDKATVRAAKLDGDLQQVVVPDGHRVMVVPN